MNLLDFDFLTKGSHSEVKACSRDFVPRDVGSLQGAQATNRPNFWVSGSCQVLTRVGYTWTVVQEDCDIDAHDGNDGAAVEVHHEETLEGERRHLVVHHLDEAEGKHEEDKKLAIHGGEGDP